jgi:hypothetical protein
MDIISEWVEPKPKRTVTLKRYLRKEQFFEAEDAEFSETGWMSYLPCSEHIEIDSKEVELPEGW